MDGLIALKKGALPANPTAPDVERSENITELKIAEVRVNKLVEEVTNADIKIPGADNYSMWLGNRAYRASGYF